MKAALTYENCCAPDRSAWRAWLQSNHQTSPGVWLVFYKKHSATPSVRYPEALEEALCFGWIDSIIKSVDDECYVRKFMPRNSNSTWSAVNLKLAAKLKAQGLMTEAGLAAMSNAHSTASVAVRKARVKRASIAVPAELKAALAKNKKARDYFECPAPSHRRMYLLWITSAKKDETRARRIKEAVQMLAGGKKLGMK